MYIHGCVRTRGRMRGDPCARERRPPGPAAKVDLLSIYFSCLVVVSCSPLLYHRASCVAPADNLKGGEATDYYSYYDYH